jgi:hypothetical protein
MERYAWADDPALDLTWCVSVVADSDEAAVVRAFGGEPGGGTPMTFREAEADAGEHFGEYTNLVVLCHDCHVVTMDGYGYSGTVPEIARRASAGGGRFFGFHTDMNGNSRIVEAEDGVVTAFFEPLFVNDRDIAHPRRPAWVADTPFPGENMQAACLAALEQRTGLVFERTWLDVVLPTYRIPDPDVFLEGVPQAREP